MKVAAESSSFGEAAESAADESAAFDLFLIRRGDEAEGAAELAEALERSGVRAWVAEGHGKGKRFSAAPMKVLERVPAAALVVGSSGLPGEWGRRELDECARRKRGDPAAFRLLLVYLPEAEPVPGEALPPTDAVVSFGAAIDEQGVQEIVAALGSRTAPPPIQTLSTSVDDLAELTGPVTSFAIVRHLLEAHPGYALGAKRPPFGDEPSSARKQDVAHWLAEVRGLYKPDALPVLHGRHVIDALARLDKELERRLRDLRLLEPIRGEIEPPVDQLLRPRRDAVDLHADLPAEVDELGRALLAKALAVRIRRVRRDERERLERGAEPKGRRGRLLLLARALAMRIREFRRTERERLPRGTESKGRRGPLLVHVYGRWGSGKTSLLRFLRRELENTEFDVPPKRTFRDAFRELRRRQGEPDELGGDPRLRWIVIDFNAWEHQRIVPPWWWLMAEVSREGGHRLREFDKPRWLRFKVWDYKWRLRGAVPGVFIIAAGLVFAWFVWKDTMSSDSSSLHAAEGVAKSFSAIIALLLTAWGGAKALSRWLLVGSPRAAGKVLAHGADPLNALSLRFAGLVRRLHYPIVIFVDDLDRCQANYVVELLEGIQTLFKDVPATYVVAADRSWVCESFAHEYVDFCPAAGEPGRPLGYFFLEKTFQVSIQVPALSDDEQRSYLHRLLESTDGKADESLEQARKEAGKLFQGISSRDEIDAELHRYAEETPVQQQAAVEAAVLRLAAPEFEQETEHLLQPFAPLLEPNPRSMKRLVNAYGVASANQILRRFASNGAGPSIESLALWTILGLRWPLLADYLELHPEATDHIVGRTAHPPADGPAWLPVLWKNEDVRDVLTGNAPGVSASLDAVTVRSFTGRRHSLNGATP